MSTLLLHPLRALTHEYGLLLYTDASAGLTHDVYHLHTCGTPIRGKLSTVSQTLQTSYQLVVGLRTHGSRDDPIRVPGILRVTDTPYLASTYMAPSYVEVPHTGYASNVFPIMLIPPEELSRDPLIVYLSGSRSQDLIRGLTVSISEVTIIHGSGHPQGLRP
jgi:hypothetical protein